MISCNNYVIPSILSLDNYNSNYKYMYVANAQEIISTNTNMNDNIDPLASFGSSLNQMDFGYNFNNDYNEKGIKKNTPTKNNSSNYENNNDNGNADPQTSPTENLLDVIEEKKKQKSIDPRTHG